MNLSDRQGKKAVKCDTVDTLERTSDNIERLTSLVEKMNMKIDKQETSFKPQIYQKQRRGQNRQNFRQDDYWRRDRYDNRERNFDRNRRNNRGFGQGNFRGRFRGNFRIDYGQNNFRDQNRNRSVCRDRNTYQNRDRGYIRERGYGRERRISPRQLQLIDRRDSGVRARSNSDSRSWSRSRVSTNRDRIRCFKCREYDHFVDNCPNSVTDEDSDSGSMSPTALQILTENENSLNLGQDLNM